MSNNYKKLTLLLSKNNLDLTVKGWLFIEQLNLEYATDSFYSEFLRKLTLFQVFTKKLTLLKKLALRMTHSVY